MKAARHSNLTGWNNISCRSTSGGWNKIPHEGMKRVSKYDTVRNIYFRVCSQLSLPLSRSLSVSILIANHLDSFTCTASNAKATLCCWRAMSTTGPSTPTCFQAKTSIHTVVNTILTVPPSCCTWQCFIYRCFVSLKSLQGMIDSMLQLVTMLGAWGHPVCSIQW